MSDVSFSSAIQALIDEQLASGQTAGVSAVLRSALRSLVQFGSADASEQTKATERDPMLRELYDKLEQSKLERDFIISLTARQREIPHPEAIMQLTAEAIGRRLSIDRVGFYRVVGQTLEFGAGWTNGRLRLLRGRLPLAVMGDGFLELMRDGKPAVIEDNHSDPARKIAPSIELNSVAEISLPLIRDMSWTACLFVHHAEARPWLPIEIALITEIAELTWDAVERADALRRLTADVADREGMLLQAAHDLRDETSGRLTAESHVRQLQKMEAVGQLTGGLAHDFNNMLAVIIGGLNLTQRRLARGDTDVTRFIEGALEGATRAATLTQRLLAFSRQQPLAPETLDANRLIIDMMEMLHRTLGDAVSVETVLGAGVWPIWADGSQLENAILNLAVNARDAMADGGNLTIETSNVHADETYARENAVAAGQYVVVALTDTGTGMTQEVKARVFEPFYTTKDVGKGTGLGLSQVFGFTKQSNGNVKIYSEVGHGTTVKIYLPRFYGEAEPAAIRRAAEVASPIQHGNPREIVLVVEDEERVRNFSVEGLRELGYTVLHVGSGEQALEVFRSHQDVTLLFTDIVMPGMTGRQLADKAQQLRPGLRVLYTTGFTRNAIVHNGVLDPGTNFLPKPFGLDQLATVVRRVLDQKT